MADYFTQFSCALDLGSTETVARAIILLDKFREDDASEDNAIFGFDAAADPLRPGTLYFTDGGQGEPEHVIRFVLACSDAFDLQGRWGFVWALTCSRHRLDGFGGGAQLLDLGARKSLAWIDCEHWLASALDPEVQFGNATWAEEAPTSDETSIPKSDANREDEPIAASPLAIVAE